MNISREIFKEEQMKSSKKLACFARSLSVIVVLVILVSSLSACRKDEKKVVPTGPAKVVIAMQGDNVPAEKNIVLDALGKATNTEIEMIYTPRADYETKMSTMIAAGTPPDMFRTDVNSAMELKSAGMLANVSSYLDTLGKNIKADVGQYLPKCPINNDGIYMILNGWLFWARQLNLRTDWLKNLGMDMPTDIQSLYDVFYAFTYKDPNRSGKKDTYGIAANGQPMLYETIFGAFGIPVPDMGLYPTIILADGTLTTWAKHPKFLDAIGYIKKLHADGLVEPDWATIPNMELFGKLWTGIAGSIEWECVGPTNNWMPGRYTETVKPTFGFPIIKGPDGSHGVTPRFIDVLNGYVISSKADAAACVRVADYVKTEEGQNLLYFGVEGTMFRWVDKDNGQIEYLGQYTDTATFRTNGGWVYWENFLTPANSAGLRALNKQSREGQIQAWAEGLSNVANVIAVLQSRIEYGGEMDQILNEMFANLIVTRDDVKRVYDRYIREWENAGGRLWEKEVNEAWIAQGRTNN
jgi:putative aldouronate transport system substrate-binding protein